MSELSTARLWLRHRRAADAGAFAALNANPGVMQFMPGCLSLIRSQSDAFAGLSPVTFTAPFTPAALITWRAGRASGGCGYPTEAARDEGTGT
jgi:hypothetical protein